MFSTTAALSLRIGVSGLPSRAGAKVRRFLIPSKCFERKVCESWQFFALFYKIRTKRGYFWGKGRKKGIFREHDHLVMEAAWEAKRGHIVGKRCLGGAKQGQENRGNGARRTETRVSYDWEAIFSLLYIYSAGKAKVAVVGKSTPSCPLGGGQKPIAHPSGWSRDPFGMEGGTRTSGFLMQEN